MAPSPERVLSTESSYGAGRAIEDFSVPLTKVGTAVTEAMADLQMASIQPGRDGAVYKIQAKTEDKRSVMVTLRPHQTQTRVSCRIGTFGDEALSKRSWSGRASAWERSPLHPFPSMPRARLDPTHSSRAPPCPTKRCSRTPPKHPIAIASFRDA